MRRADFRIVGEDRLPSIATLLDGLSRQSSIEALDENDNDQSNAEAHLVQCLTAIHEAQTNLAYPIIDPQDTPRNFNEVCQEPDWAAAIDREYDALIRRRTWVLVTREPSMNVIKHKWVFRKPIENDGGDYFCKARCVARGVQQEPGLGFNPESLYAPVAAQESIRLIISFAANTDAILEGGDTSNPIFVATVMFQYSWSNRPIQADALTNQTVSVNC